MLEVTTSRSIDVVLFELAQVLNEERAALLALDATHIDALNIRKLGLDTELAAHTGDFSDSQKSCLQTLKQQLRNNLILLVHARDHIQARLGFEEPPIVPRPSAKPVVGGSRLNLRG